MPLTSQEEMVRRLLIDRRLSFEQHHVFDLGKRGRLSVDFLVVFGPGIVLECTSCSTKRGKALSEIRRRSAFINYRFQLLKTAFPGLICGALIEAPNEDQAKLASELTQILTFSNFNARGEEELREALSVIQAGHDN